MPSGGQNRFPQEVVDRIRRLIEDEKLQQKKVAELLHISQSAVERICKRNHIKTQRTGPRDGEGSPLWKGGRVIVGRYMYVYAPEHPHATKCRRVAEHRLVMEKKLGRFLSPSEVVHHIDGDSLNNHPDNLQVFDKNSMHLRHELTGHVPNWTPEGYLNMSLKKLKYEGTPEERRKQAQQRFDMKRRSRARGVRPQPPPIDHPTS